MTTPEVQRLLDLHKSLVLDTKTQKIKCSLTNHEMPAKVSAIESYVSGKKYKRLADFNLFPYEEHKEHIVQNRKKEHELFCNLTLRHLEKTAKAIRRHINGRKYKNALARWKECQKTGSKFTPTNQRKAKKQPTDDDDVDDKNDDKSDDNADDDEEVDDAASDGTVVEDESSDDDGEDDDDDDMSDLYPAADFQEMSDEEEEDEKENEVEEKEEEEEEVATKSKKSGAKKRSNKSNELNGHGPAKKKKIKKQKT